MRKLIVAAILMLALSPTVLRADSLNGSPGAGWQTWTSAQLNHDGSPYWDGGGADNVGYCMSGTGTCGMANPPGFIPYWGFADGTADQHITFTPTGANVATIQIELAAAKDLNEFGYHDTTGDHILFTGPQGAGSMATFTAIGNYAFFIVAFGGTDIYYTDSSLNPTDPGFQHFAVFNAGPGTYYLGAEDSKSTDPPDNDFNDMVVKITTVPEPSSVALVASGLLALVVRRRSSSTRH